MKKAIKQLWNLFLSSVEELEEPLQRAFMVIALVAILAIILGLFIGGVFNFVENIIELLCNTINTCVIGEFPELPVE